MRKKVALSVLAFLLCLCFSCLAGCKKVKVQTEGTEGVAQTESSMEDFSVGCCDDAPIGYYNEICVIEDCLYYCDPDRKAALYAYNMKTKEEVCVTELSGQLYNTQRGYFYLSGDFVYRLDGLEAILFCELPEDGDFIGFFHNKIVWAKRERHTEMREDGSSRERFARQSIWWQEEEENDSVVKISTEVSKQLYYIPQEQGHLGTIGTTEEGIYFEQNMEIAPYNVIYYLPYETKEVKQVMEGELWNVLFYDDKTVLLRAEDHTGFIHLFRANPITLEIQKLNYSNLSGIVLLQDGKVYYNGDNAIRCYTITDDTYKVLSADRYSDLDYSEVALYKNYLILRHGYGYSFYVLDMETREITPVSD